ncbi:MAG: type VI secretion system contractile sheath large subunit [Planctomycetes bacterium]|nr:type VI secretion system contractile sheath large subunit [Planctomycetota bacterium]
MTHGSDRPSRVRLQFSAPSGDELRAPPPAVLVLADLGLAAQAAPLGERTPVELDPLTFDDRLAELRPEVDVTIPDWLAGGAELPLRIAVEDLDDLEPERLCRRVAPLAERIARRRGAGDDALLSAWVLSVAGAPELRRVEAVWRGLRRLAQAGADGDPVRVGVLHVTRAELASDLASGPGVIRSLLAAPFDHAGATPWTFVATDLAIGRDAGDRALLAALARAGGAVHAPVLADAAPALLGLEAFAARALAELDAPPSLADWGDDPDWRAFLASDDARWAVLCLPRVLQRPALGSLDLPVRAFGWQSPPMDDDRLHCWGGAALALAECAARSLATIGWPTAITGVAGGGLLEALPVTYSDAGGEPLVIGPTEVPVSDTLERRLAAAGYATLVAMRNSDRAVFLSAPSLAAAAPASGPGGRLRDALVAGRVTQVLRALARDGSDRDASPDERGRTLAAWLAAMTAAGDRPPVAERPLRSARLRIATEAGPDGALRVELELVPGLGFEPDATALHTAFDLPTVGRPG